MIRAAVAGLGWWGKHIVRRLAESQKIKVVAAVEPALEKHAEFAKQYGLPVKPRLEDVLEDKSIDAVILATPHSMHTAQVTAAAAAGKHVFCEKPLALTRADAEKSVAACKAAGVVLGIGHERRFEPALKEVRRLVASGELGTIMHVEANFSHDKLANVPLTDWRSSSKDSPAAGMTGMGIHLTDAFISMFGPITEVFASTAQRVRPAENGDVVSVDVRFASGATGYLNAILVTPLYLRFTVFGSTAWVEVRNHTHPDTPGPSTLTLQRSGAAPEVRTYEWTDSVRENLEAFADACEGRGTYPFTDEQKIGNIAVLEAICRSAATKTLVTLK